MLIFACFFIFLTLAAIGTDGVNSLSQRSIGISVLPELSSQQQEPVTPQQQEREAARIARQKRQEEASVFRHLTLVSVPPLSAEPLPLLVAYEYTSLFIYLIRYFLARPLWHALLWWHVICALFVMYEVISWRWSESSNDTPAPWSTVVAHAIIWSSQALIFGWPSIYWLRRQLDIKTKDT